MTKISLSTKTIVNIQEKFKVMNSKINLNKRTIITVWKRKKEKAGVRKRASHGASEWVSG